MIRVGESIPDFELDAFVVDSIIKIKLSDLRGKWLVLIFYPADFTYVCPTELEQASELYDDFKNLGAEVMSLSTDTAYSHKAWHNISKAVGKVQFPMLSDPSGKVCRMFGTYIEDEGLSLRATFIINPDGKVMSLEMHNNAIGRNAEEILRKLQALKRVDGNPDEVCPAKWRPGEKTIKPKFDLIGSI